MADRDARGERLRAIASELDCYWTGPLPLEEFLRKFLPNAVVKDIARDESFLQAMAAILACPLTEGCGGIVNKALVSFTPVPLTVSYFAVHGTWWLLCRKAGLHFHWRSRLRAEATPSTGYLSLPPWHIPP
jgi:hypothetical protein